jgi:hypothetical protein
VPPTITERPVGEIAARQESLHVATMRGLIARRLLRAHVWRNDRQAGRDAADVGGVVAVVGTRFHALPHVGAPTAGVLLLADETVHRPLGRIEVAAVAKDGVGAEPGPHGNARLPPASLPFRDAAMRALEGEQLVTGGPQTAGLRRGLRGECLGDGRRNDSGSRPTACDEEEQPAGNRCPLAAFLHAGMLADAEGAGQLGSRWPESSTRRGPAGYAWIRMSR